MSPWQCAASRLLTEKVLHDHVAEQNSIVAVALCCMLLLVSFLPSKLQDDRPCPWNLWGWNMVICGKAPATVYEFYVDVMLMLEHEVDRLIAQPIHMLTTMSADRRALFMLCKSWPAKPHRLRHHPHQWKKPRSAVAYVCWYDPTQALAPGGQSYACH